MLEMLTSPPGAGIPQVKYIHIFLYGLSGGTVGPQPG